MIDLPEAIYPINQDGKDQLNKKISSQFYTEKYGKVINKYGYRDEAGELIFVSIEFEKGTIPLYWSKEGWIKAIPKNIRPINLFHLHKKPKNCNNIFIVNEEKNAIKNIQGWHGLSWAGGHNRTINFHNWRKLLNVENILIWTDEKSARKIKSRLPHAKIIDSGKFEDCPNHLDVFEKKLELNNLTIPAPDPYEFYKFICA